MEKHGDFFLESLDNTILTVTKGPYNLEAYMAYSDSYEKHVRAKQHGWASLTILVSESLMMNEVHEYYQRQLKWRVKHGLEQVVVIYIDSTSPMMTDYQVKNVMKDYSEVSYESTHDIHHGLNLLVDKGYLSSVEPVIEKLAAIEWLHLNKDLSSNKDNIDDNTTLF